MNVFEIDRCDGKYFSRRRCTWAARVALFAVLLNTWAPTVTALLAQASGRVVAITEHCLAIADQTNSPSPSPGAPADNKDKKVSCPFCFAHAGSFGLVPAAVVPQVAVLVVSSIRQVLVEPAPAGMPWVNPQPRGPPASA
jgi:hypothetical protein